MADLYSLQTPLKLAAFTGGVILLGTLTKSYWLRLKDWLTVQCSLLGLQASLLNKGMRGLNYWLTTQHQVWQLMLIEKDRRLEVLQYRRAGLSPFGPMEPHLKHVDSLASRKRPSRKKTAKIQPLLDTPILTDVVLIGGGHSHAYVIKKFGMEPIPGVRVTLISRDIMTPYSGMIPGYVAGFYTKEECHIDLCVLARFANARFIHAEAMGIDTEHKLVVFRGNRPSISYDILSIDIGSTPKRDIPSGFKNPCITPAKPIDGLSARVDAIFDRVLNSSNKMTIIVVGGGAGGCELCLSLHARLRRELKRKGEKLEDKVKMQLVTRSLTLFPLHAVETHKIFVRIFRERGIEIGFGCSVVEARDGKIICTNGKEFKADEVIWCTQAGAANWLKQVKGLELDEDGFIKVNSYMESSINDVFACGDIAALPDPRPKAGVFAVKAGPYVSQNIRNAILGLPRTKWAAYKPQKAFLGLIGTGEKSMCVASKGNFALQSNWLWDLKDWIDRKWMAGYTYALPVMYDEDSAASAIYKYDEAALDVLKHASMRCGGCGAKVGSTILSRVLERLRSTNDNPGIPSNAYVLKGIEDPDDGALMVAPSQSQVLVHTIDFFREVVNDPYLFGKISANHALSDCYAMGAKPVSALAVAVIPYSKEEKVETALYQMMVGACETLRESGCALVGGHSCEGNELSLGFAVNGVVDKSEVLSKGGLHEGYAVILTKPIGTGTVLAAEMRREAKGIWWEAAIISMTKSNQEAAKIVRSHKASACTDVTGFGLLGHLIEMVKSSSEGIRVELLISNIPLLQGALECVKRGIFSTLHPSNLKLKHAIINEREALVDPIYPLLYDPQTAGGLLACVPRTEAEACVRELKKAGYMEASIIGYVTSDSSCGENPLNGNPSGSIRIIRGRHESSNTK